MDLQHKLKDIPNDELVYVEVYGFNEDNDFEVHTRAADIKTELSFASFTSRNGLGMKAIQEFRITTYAGVLLCYNRPYRGKGFKRVPTPRK